MNRLVLGGGVALVLIAFVALASLFTVKQTEQVLITQFGQPIRVISKPGLHAKLRYFQAVGAQENGIRARLNSVVTSSLRRVLGSETLLNVLSSERARIMGRIKVQVADEMKGFGVAIEDVRLRRADLPEANTQAILGRMKSERERVASQARAEGAEASLRIRADADRDRVILLAEARAAADRLRGDGERLSIKTYADAFQQDPQFYDTYRTLQAYREAFGKDGGSRLVLTPGNDFLRLLREAPKP